MLDGADEQLPAEVAAEPDSIRQRRYCWKAGSTAGSPPWVSSRAIGGVPPGQPSEAPCATSLTWECMHLFDMSEKRQAYL